MHTWGEKKRGEGPIPSIPFLLAEKPGCAKEVGPQFFSEEAWEKREGGLPSLFSYRQEEEAFAAAG